MSVFSSKKKINEGKAKILFEGTSPGFILQHFKDDLTAFNNQKLSRANGKGSLNNRISAHLMSILEQLGVATHYVKIVNMREQLIKKLDMYPVEIIVRNFAAGSILKRIDVKYGERFFHPITEFYYKNDSLNDPMISEDHILAMDMFSPWEYDEIKRIANKANDIISGVFMSVGIKLFDIKFEFGRDLNSQDEQTQIVLADEISPDCCRLRDAKTGKILDKDIFREKDGEEKSLILAYEEVASRLGLIDGKRQEDDR